MIILEEDNTTPSTSGERTPLKSPASNPNVILSPVTRPPDSGSLPPPPPYASTSTSTHPTLSQNQNDDDDFHLEIRKFFVPAPYTRRTFARFVYAFFVAVLIITAATVLLERVVNAINKADHGPGRDRGRGRDRRGRDRERHWVDKEWIIGRPDEPVHCRATERALPIRYPPHLRCVDENVVGKADVQLNSLS